MSDNKSSRPALLLAGLMIVLAGLVLFRLSDLRRLADEVGDDPETRTQVMDLPFPRTGLEPPVPSAETKALTKPYHFTEDWFSWNEGVWWEVLGPLAGKPDLHYLEVGLFEGYSALWMVENVLTHPTSTVTGIDPFFEADVEERYHENLEISENAEKFTTLKGLSQEVLPGLEREAYDVVYIDGSHTADDVLADAVMSWELLKEGGLVIFDDFGWNPRVPSELRPMLAVESFITAYRNRLEVVHRGYQVVLRKVPGPHCAAKQFCSKVGDRFVYYWPTNELTEVASGQRVPLTQAEVLLVEELLRSRRFGTGAWTFVPEDLEPLRASPEFGGLVERLGLEL